MRNSSRARPFLCKSWRSRLLFSVFVAGFGIYAMPAFAQAPELLTPVPSRSFAPTSVEQSQRVERLRREPTTKSLELVSMNLSALDGETTSLTLPNQRTLEFRKQSKEVIDEKNFVWHGTLFQVPGTAILVVRNGAATGIVQDGSDTYRIEPVDGNLHALIKIDQSKFPPDHPPSFEKKEQELQKRGDLPVAPTTPRKDAKDSGPVGIDVLVAYTPSAKASVADIIATIQLAVAEANQSYVNSAIAIRLNLVDNFEFSYSEAGKSFDTILADFVADPDISRRRDASRADLSALIINQSDFCGLADDILAKPSTAFAIVHYSCATGYYSFAHELGHLMGARHDEAHDPTTAPFPYGHGYQRISSSSSWRTIMAYDCPAGCPRLQYWSNPNISYTGVPMGTSGTNDNARVLNETATRASAFRPLSIAPQLKALFGN